jgi:PAS domain S-box-containing protein
LIGSSSSAKRLLSSDSSGGWLLRRMLPAAIAALVILAFLRWLGEHHGLYSAGVGVILMTFVSVSMITGLVWHFASCLDREDAARRVTDAELRRGARYFELSHDMVCTAGFDGVFRQLNAAWTTTLGWSEEELRSRPFVEFVHPDDRERTERESGVLAEGGTTVDFANRYAAKDGGWRWIDWRSMASAEDGLIYASARDVTDRKESEAALEASERQTRQILETAHEAFISIDSGGLITDWNPQAQATFGWTREEVLGRRLSHTIVPESHREAHDRGIERCVQTGEGPVLGQLVELPALHRDGHEFTVELTISLIRTQDGLSFNAFLRDTTQRKAAAELVERQRRQMAEAQAVGHFGSWEWDIAADTIEWSDGLHRIYGEEPTDEPETFEGFVARVHPDDRVMVQAQIEAAFSTATGFSFEHRVIRADGAVRIMHANGDVVVSAAGVPERMRGTGQDVTERREAERAKDQFTSVVSHELRTPLTSIRGSLGLLESGVLGPLPEKGQRMVEIAVQNTDRLVRLINDILDLERIGSREVDMRPELCDARDLIEQAAQGVAQLAADVGVQLALEGEPVALVADPDRVLQTLTNLISNAIKYSPAGAAVRLSCARQGQEVLFAVSDAGRGIPADKLESIFGRFQQVDASDAREKGGTGLGLAICKTIVEHHGGRIWAASELGAGSTFSFVLPAQPDGGPRPSTQVAGGPTILVCDDDASVVEIVATMLEQRGYRVLAAHSGDEALALALAERPDAILLDLLMPGTSGWETAAALKRHPETDAIPVVILSVLSAAETDAPGATVADWVQKPLDEAALFEALGRAIGTRDGPFRVLIVEDDVDLATVLMAVFERHGVQTFHAPDGRAAIELSQQLMPDMLVLDVGLPETDGFEVVDWLRRHDRLSALPLVVYTARDLDAADRQRLQLGVNTEFLTKGRITPQQFEQRVIGLLRRITQAQIAGGAR